MMKQYSMEQRISGQQIVDDGLIFITYNQEMERWQLTSRSAVIAGDLPNTDRMAMVTRQRNAIVIMDWAHITQLLMDGKWFKLDGPSPETVETNHFRFIPLDEQNTGEVKDLHFRPIKRHDFYMGSNIITQYGDADGLHVVSKTGDGFRERYTLNLPAWYCANPHNDEYGTAPLMIRNCWISVRLQPRFEDHEVDIIDPDGTRTTVPLLSKASETRDAIVAHCEDQ